MKSAFDRCMVWLVDHRLATLLAVLLITLLSVIGHFRPEWVRQFFVTPQTQDAPASNTNRRSNTNNRFNTNRRSNKDNTSVRTIPNVDPVSLSASDAVIVVQSPRFFTPAGAKAMRHVVDELEKLDYVRAQRVGAGLWLVQCDWRDADVCCRCHHHSISVFHLAGKQNSCGARQESDRSQSDPHQ